MIALATFFFRAFEKTLTLREHQEFKEASKERLNEWRAQIYRDFDKVEADIKTLEHTRPTSGELKLAMEAVSARLLLVEELVKDLKGKNDTS